VVNEAKSKHHSLLQIKVNDFFERDILLIVDFPHNSRKSSSCYIWSSVMKAV
jgi:hypothetical protein